MGRLSAEEMDWALLTPEARSDLLIEKHLGGLDSLLLNRFVLPFIGISNASRAAQAEEQENWNKHVAETEERLTIIEQFDREYARRLREEFYVTSYRRTRSAQW